MISRVLFFDTHPQYKGYEIIAVRFFSLLPNSDNVSHLYIFSDHAWSIYP